MLLWPRPRIRSQAQRSGGLTPRIPRPTGYRIRARLAPELVAASWARAINSPRPQPAAGLRSNRTAALGSTPPRRRPRPSPRTGRREGCDLYEGVSCRIDQPVLPRLVLAIKAGGAGP